MIHWEPSDRKDRRMQRAKLREMWESIGAEKARLMLIDWCGRTHYGVDNTLTERELDENGKLFHKCAGVLVGAFIVMGVVLCLTC